MLGADDSVTADGEHGGITRDHGETPMTTVALADATPEAPPREAPSGTAIATRGLTKVYSARRVVDRIDLDIPRGRITGFVGPNGAGKTTTIRMLLGLVRPTEGSAQVLGCDIDTPYGYLPRVGALIEGPAFHPAVSGRRNLLSLALLGGHPRARVDEVLDIVGLGDRGGDLYRTYSLGMKQRLGVAAALLPQPELLVLDEPANGLDPAGIIEVRTMLRRLRDSGMTVFISSHLLGELEQIAEWMVVLQQGRLAFQGPIDELLSRRHSALRVAGETAADLEVIAAVARRLGLQPHLASDHVRVDGGRQDAARLSRAVCGAGVALTELAIERSTLEETFLDITGEA